MSPTNLIDSFRIKAAAQRLVKIFRGKSKYQREKQMKEELARKFYSGELLQLRRRPDASGGGGSPP